MQDIPTNIARIREQIRAAAEAAGRDPQEVRLMLATKTQLPETLREALAADEHLFGENRVQELVPKVDALTDAEITWHFIGHLQTNKVRDVVGRVACIQSIDRTALADEVQRACEKRTTSIDVMIEVNTSGEASKHGVAPDEAWSLIDHVRSCSALRIVGFMTIGALSEDEATVRKCFVALREIRDAYDAKYGTRSELSMGMSSDLAWAIAEGSTIVRVGTAAFGARNAHA
jgi:pyridoxal phosphate enzyme (YggS family)